MTSFRQIEANRRNAHKSTGPNTEEGKQRSRCNAVRHGLTAETVIGALEDAEDYKAFEAAIIADYDAQSAVERELVLRLASLLWRLRRATTMETGLFEIQADYLREFRQGRQTEPKSPELIYARFGRLILSMPTPIVHRTASQTEPKPGPALVRNPLILPPISHVAFCVSPICPAIRSIASADMKQPFGAKSARFCLPSMHWIVANHKRECAVSVSVAGKTCRPTDATIELPDPPIYAIDAKIRPGRPSDRNKSPFTKFAVGTRRILGSLEMRHTQGRGRFPGRIIIQEAPDRERGAAPRSCPLATTVTFFSIALLTLQLISGPAFQ